MLNQQFPNARSLIRKLVTLSCLVFLLIGVSASLAGAQGPDEDLIDELDRVLPIDAGDDDPSQWYELNLRRSEDDVSFSLSIAYQASPANIPDHITVRWASGEVGIPLKSDAEGTLSAGLVRMLPARDGAPAGSLDTSSSQSTILFLPPDTGEVEIGLIDRSWKYEFVLPPVPVPAAIPVIENVIVMEQELFRRTGAAGLEMTYYPFGDDPSFLAQDTRQLFVYGKNLPTSSTDAIEIRSGSDLVTYDVIALPEDNPGAGFDKGWEYAGVRPDGERTGLYLQATFREGVVTGPYGFRLNGAGGIWALDFADVFGVPFFAHEVRDREFEATETFFGSDVGYFVIAEGTPIPVQSIQIKIVKNGEPIRGTDGGPITAERFAGSEGAEYRSPPLRFFDGSKPSQVPPEDDSSALNIDVRPGDIISAQVSTGGEPAWATIVGAATDIQVDGVPTALEFDAGGFIPVGDMRKIRLTTPDSGSVALAIMTGARDIRVWRDRTRTQLVTFTASVSGPPKVEWDGEDAPSVLWVEGVKPSARVRAVHLRLSSAERLVVSGIDDAALTVVQLDVAIPGLRERDEDVWTPLVGLNDDDDNANGMRDSEETTTPIVGENDLRLLQVVVRPPIPPTFGSVEIDINRGISLWSNRDKGAAAMLIDTLASDPTRRILAPHEQNGEYFLEGVDVPKAPVRVTLAFTPQLRGTKLGPVIRDYVTVGVVQTDIDIDGLADEGVVEVDPGGVVEIADDAKLPLDLHLRMSGKIRGRTRLALTKGGDSVRLWRRAGDRFVEIELQTGEDGIPALDFPTPEEMPRQIFVEGLNATPDRAVALELSHFARFATDATLKERKIHSDEIRLTVRGTELQLSPALITVLHDPSQRPGKQQLALVINSAEGAAPVPVHDDTATRYWWIGKGLPINMYDLPLADVMIDSGGMLTVTSPGLQIIQATHGDLKSNYALVMAGITLKELDLVPRSVLTSGPGLLHDDPPLILAADANALVSDRGHIVVRDVVFGVGKDQAEISLALLVKALKPLRAKLPPIGQAIWVVVENGFEFGLTALVDFKSTDKDVVQVRGGFAQSGQSGIAGVTGTLSFDDFGEAADSVTVVVLPTIEGAEIRAADDAPGEHAAPIVLTQSDPPGPGTRVRAHAWALLAKSAPIPFQERAESILPEGWAVGALDVEKIIAGVTMRFQGRIDEVDQGGERKSIVFQDLRVSFDVPNERPTLPFLSNDWNEPGADLFSNDISGVYDITLTPNPDTPSGGSRLATTVAIAGMGETTTIREVMVVDETSDPESCIAGEPILYMGERGKVSARTLDRRFDGAPFSQAAAAADGPAQRLAGRAGPAVGGAPVTAGWPFYIEFPVNAPEKCALALQRSIATGEDENIANLPLVSLSGSTAIATADAAYSTSASDTSYALVYAGAPGWKAYGGERQVQRLVQRVSVYDKASGEFRATVVIALQMTMEPSAGIFRHALVGSSAGTTGSGFSHTPPVDARSRFTGIDPL